MEYREQHDRHIKVKPRLIIHGGAGNIRREDITAEKYRAYRDALLTIVSHHHQARHGSKLTLFKVTKANDYMTTPISTSSGKTSPLPAALDVSTYAVTLLEDNPLFNIGHGAVFTRDGINELEASVMVSRGFKKRGVGVMGLRRVRNPILLAKAMLEHGEDDLEARSSAAHRSTTSNLDVPSAQGHTQIFGDAAEQLAEQYGLEMVDPSYFFTQRRWDEHKRALEREKAGKGMATWSADEYLPQGTVGAVALDEKGVICVATSTGGMTNKLTGRVGDTPVIGSGFWAEEWIEDGDPTGKGFWQRLAGSIGPAVVLTDGLRGALADCFPTPYMYTPMRPRWLTGELKTTRSIAGSGTGNGDSFLRTNALRTMAAIARWKGEAGAKAIIDVSGPGGELQKSAGDRWGRTGEGEGGIVGIELAVVRDSTGSVIEVRSDILMDYNCGGMFRAWIDDDGKAVMSIWSNGSSDKL